MTGKAVFATFPERGDDDKPTGRFRWRLIAANGEAVAQGTEGYRDVHDAKRGVQDIVVAACEAAGATVPDLHDIPVRGDAR